MEFKGTKGEWRVIKIDISDYKQICIASDVSTTVLSHIHLPHNLITKEIEANAKLIAAAPELLEALKKALAVTSTLNTPQIDWLNGHIRNAIKKATE